MTIYRVTSADGSTAIVLAGSCARAEGILPWVVDDVEKIGVVTADVHRLWRAPQVLAVQVAS